MVGAVLIIAVTLGVGLPRLHAKRERYYDVRVQPSESPLYTFHKSALVSDGEPCAAIGKSILNKGGNAVDAAVAMVFCGGVVNPVSTGLGGGLLMTIYNSSNKKVEVVDARETAPSAATEDMFDGNRTKSLRGGLAIAVPGELRGLEMAHQKYGKLNWTDLIMPAVSLCREGVRVSAYMDEKLQASEEDILKDPGLRAQFMNPETGGVYKTGDLLKRPLLGDTLEKIAVGGPNVLYTGEMAQTIAKEIQTAGGIITAEDLGNYSAKIRDPITLPLQGGKDVFYGVSLPGSGVFVASILNVLSGYNFNASSVADIDSTVLTFHRMIESYKFAYAQRSHLGDPDMVNTTKIVSEILSPEYGSRTRSKITDDTTHPLQYYGSEYMVDDHGTSHCQVLDSNGDAVTVTSTINGYFGSHFASPTTGIVFNNEMDDFSSPNMTNFFGLPPSKGNFISPGRRPLSSMCPSLVVDSTTGQVKYVLGGNGGSRIITAITQVIANILWFGKNIKEAIDDPRFHHQLYPEYLQVEPDFAQVYRDKLQDYGHEIRNEEIFGSIVLGIVRTSTGDINVNYDHRKGGSAAGE